MAEAIEAVPAPPEPTTWAGRFLDSDVWASFKRSKLTMAAAFLTALFLAAAVLAGLLSPQDPFDPGAARADEQPAAADLGRGGADALPARHRRAGPRHLLGHPLRPADLARSSASSASPSRRPSASRSASIAGYVGGTRRCGHHAHRRRAADLPGDPDRASRRRRGQVRPRRPARRARRRSPCSSSPSA